MSNGLQQPALCRARIWCDIGGGLYGIGAEQLSRAGEQGAYLVELLLQRRISHGPTLPRASWLHNSPTA